MKQHYVLLSILILLSLGMFVPQPASARKVVSLDSSGKLVEYKAIHHTRYLYIADTFKTLAWNTEDINLYKLDVTKLTDTFHIILNDTTPGQHFTFPVKGGVTSAFGPRRAFGFNYHFGTDIALQHGDTVASALPGVVRLVKYDRGYGNFIVVAHANGLETLYGHLAKTLVKPGQLVASGESIGLGGNTGWSTGHHLHFEFRFLGTQFDPKIALSFEEGKVIKDTLHIDKSWFNYLVELSAVRYHTIRYGDTLGHIALRYGTSINYLCRLNGIGVRTILRPGRALRVR